MAQTESALSPTVLDSVKTRMRHEAQQYKSYEDMAASARKQARDCQDEADQARARYDHCKLFLDEHDPDWLASIASEDTSMYVLYPDVH